MSYVDTGYWQFDYVAEPIEDPADVAVPGVYRLQTAPGHYALTTIAGAYVLPSLPGNYRGAE